MSFAPLAPIAQGYFSIYFEFEHVLYNNEDIDFKISIARHVKSLVPNKEITTGVLVLDTRCIVWNVKLQAVVAEIIPTQRWVSGMADQIALALGARVGNIACMQPWTLQS